jgi:hypothetical protein
MTAMTIGRKVCIEVGLPIPSDLVTSAEASYIKIVNCMEDAANELARRVDWRGLQATTTITGTGSNDNFALPSGFSRLTSGNSVSIGGTAVRGGLSDDEWFALPATEGTPRFYRLKANTISFYPYPANGASLLVSYLSENWCSSGGKVWVADADTALLPEELIVKGAVWRFKRSQGQDYADQLAEFEASLVDFEAFDKQRHGR